MDAMKYFWDCQGIVPLLILFGTGVIILVMDAFAPKGQKGKLAYVALFGTFLALWSLKRPLPLEPQLFGNMLYADGFALFFDALLLLVTALVILFSIGTLQKEHVDHGEYYSLLLFSTFGMMLMAQAAHLVVVFLGLEILSISIYILVGVFRHQFRSNEAALKYFLLGAFASGFFLYGLTFLYGAVGALSYGFMAAGPGNPEWFRNPFLVLGTALVLVGFGFKVALVPFHMWTPDVYEGAPTPITAYMAIGVKTAVFAALTRFFWVALPSMHPYWLPALWALSVLTMTLGNIVALVQDNVKRMLAYSSIAHAGYILMSFVVLSKEALAGMLVYLLAYAFMTAGAFGVVVLMQDRFGTGEKVSDYRGIAYRYPLLAATMALFFFSLAGIPPTAGFVAKFFVFSAAIKGGQLWLVIIGLLNSVVAAYYYLRLVVILYSRSPESASEPGPLTKIPALTVGALAFAAWGTLHIGVFPESIWNWASQSVLALL